MQFSAKRISMEKGTAAAILKGWMAGAIVLAAGQCMMAMLLLKGRMKWEATGYGMLLQWTLCGYLCGAVFRRTGEQHSGIGAIMVGASFGVIAIIVAACFFGIQYDVAGMNMMLVLGGAAASALGKHRRTTHRSGGKRKR